MPLRIEMENRLVSYPLRLPGLNSTNLGHETLKTDLNFDDVGVGHSSELVSVDLHSEMEKSLGINTKMRF